MFFNKNKKEDSFTPRDLEAFERKLALHGAMRNESAGLVKEQKHKRKAAIIILIILILMLLLWAASYFATQYGDLVVSVDRSLADCGVILSETKDFDETSFVLDGGKADQVYHFTYDWFESLGVLDELDSIDGSHNGEDYFAYSFYIRNDGDTQLEYDAKLVVTGAAKSCDEAARIMVYKNGEPTIYAKPKMGTFEPEPNTVAFLDGSTVFDNLREDFEPGAIDKYTVVIWFEGNDPECINDIMGGHMRLSMLFEAAGLEE